MNHAELKEKALSNPETRVAYEEMGAEFSLLRQMIEVRRKAGLSQVRIAERMGTQAPAITRLESSYSLSRIQPAGLEAVSPRL